MSKIELGKPTQCDTGSMDAIHIAVKIVWCDVELPPGASIMPGNRQFEVVPCARESRTGIADPFRNDDILVREPFAMLLCPDLVVGMHHSFRFRDRSGFDEEGYDEDGYDEAGYDRNGCTRGCR